LIASLTGSTPLVSQSISFTVNVIDSCKTTVINTVPTS
jgi:hypothetical protein